MCSLTMFLSCAWLSFSSASTATHSSHAAFDFFEDFECDIGPIKVVVARSGTAVWGPSSLQQRAACSLGRRRDRAHAKGDGSPALRPLARRGGTACSPALRQLVHPARGARPYLAHSSFPAGAANRSAGAIVAHAWHIACLWHMARRERVRVTKRPRVASVQ